MSTYTSETILVCHVKYRCTLKANYIEMNGYSV